MRAPALVALCAFALLVTGCGGAKPTRHARTGSAPAVPQLRSIEQLRGVFDAHAGVPRLIVLISPG
jgi:hypothetical protein